MRSISDTLKIIRDITSALPDKVQLALVGGYAVILHGVERTTLDLDVCIYSDVIDRTNSRAFFNMLKEHLPQQFDAELREGSKLMDDPFKHDLIRINDRNKEFPRIDLLIARYKWELEAIRAAISVEDILIPVLSKPFLVAMKLQATGYKDASDVVELMRLMNEEEQNKAAELARRTGRDKKLSRLLLPLDEEIREMPEEYIKR